MATRTSAARPLQYFFMRSIRCRTSWFYPLVFSPAAICPVRRRFARFSRNRNDSGRGNGACRAGAAGALRVAARLLRAVPRGGRTMDGAAALWRGVVRLRRLNHFVWFPAPSERHFEEFGEIGKAHLPPADPHHFQRGDEVEIHAVTHR